MFNGVAFFSKAFKSNSSALENHDYKFAIVAGDLIADSVVRNFKKKDGTDGMLTTFTVKYHEKTYQTVKIWGNSDIAMLAGGLQKGDSVLVIGTKDTNHYQSKEPDTLGQWKEFDEMRANIIIPQSVINYAAGLMGSKSLNDMLNKDFEEQGGTMESAEDFMDADESVDDIFA